MKDIPYDRVIKMVAANIELQISCLADRYRTEGHAILADILSLLQRHDLHRPSEKAPDPAVNDAPPVAPPPDTGIPEHLLTPRYPYHQGCQHMFEKAPKIGQICGGKRKAGSIYCTRHVVQRGDGSYDNTPPAQHKLAKLNPDIKRLVHLVTGFVLESADTKVVIGRLFKESQIPEGRPTTGCGYHALVDEEREEAEFWGFAWPTAPAPSSPKQAKVHRVEERADDDPPSPGKRARKEPKEAKKADPVIVYTDGACPGNGQGAQVAGAGVWFGPGDARNLSERVPGDATNNRAELYAAVRALEATEGTEHVRIITDSQYLVNGMTSWVHDWVKKDFASVKNADLFRRLLALQQGRKVEWQYTPGHAGVEGNEQADLLARRACEQTITPAPRQPPPSSFSSLKARLKAVPAAPRKGAKEKQTVGNDEKARESTSLEEKRKEKLTYDSEDEVMSEPEDVDN